MTILSLIVWLFILGFVAWLIERSPITSPTFKSFMVYALVIIAAFMLISFVLGTTGVDVPRLR